MKPEPKAKVELLPSNYAWLIYHEGVLAKCKDQKKSCVQDADLFLSKWAPRLSRELLTDKSLNAEVMQWFLVSGFRDIASRRDGRTLTVPGPDGEKLPVDLALLWLKWATTSPGLLPTGVQWGSEALNGPRWEERTGQRLAATISSKYGSSSVYQGVLRSAIRKELTAGSR